MTQQIDTSNKRLITSIILAKLIDTDDANRQFDELMVNFVYHYS
jgi:hypothetical protein